MANARHASFVVVFTVPADDHKFKHIMAVRHIDDEADLRRHYTTHVNRDMKILNVERLTGDADDQTARVREIAEQAMKEGGDNYRPLDQSEMLLAQKQVDNIRADRQRLEEETGMAGGV